MKSTKVGKIKSIEFDELSKNLEFTVVVLDSSFKKKLLRDLSLSGNLTVEDGKYIYISNEEEQTDA